MGKTEHTLQRTETAIENQLQVAKLTLRQVNGRQCLCLSDELLTAGGIAGEKVLEDATMRRIGHCGRSVGCSEGLRSNDEGEMLVRGKRGSKKNLLKEK